MLKNIFKNFCDDTSIHGCAYISRSTSHKIEKIFWIFSVLLSFILTGVLIHKLMLESQKNPTVIYTDQNAVKIEELDFPAVSICPGLIYTTFCQTVIEYEKIRSQLLKHEKNISELSLRTLKLLQVGSLVARDHFLSDNFPSLSIPTDDFIETFHKFNLTFIPYHFYKNAINNVVRPYAVAPPSNIVGSYMSKYTVYLRHFITEFGLCLTFNSPKMKDIYNTKMTDKTITKQVDTELFGVFKTFNEGVGFYNQFDNISYPVKANAEGLHIMLNTFHVLYYNCSEQAKKKVYDGYTYNHFEHTLTPNMNSLGTKIIVHSPYEVVPNSENHFLLARHQQLYLSVTPVIFGIDDSLADKELDFRRCYLKNEKQLEFFKVYTRTNCEHECLTQMTLRSCGCVQFFMMRRKNTKICGVIDEKCFIAVENKFNEDKSACKCYDPCDNIKYEVKLQNTEGKIWSLATPTFYLKLSADSVFPTRRRLSTNFIDFVSFVGGLLGLLAGFSFLSAAELIGYFILKPLLKIFWHRSSAVHPMEINNLTVVKLNNVWKYLLDMLESSSIHGFGHIGNKTKNIFERFIWFILLTIFIILALLMMNKVFIKYHSNNIVKKFETSAVNIHTVPFPALTVARLISRDDIFNPVPKGIFNLNYTNNYESDVEGEIAIQGQLIFGFRPVFEYAATSDFVDMLKVLSTYSLIPFEIYCATWGENQNIEYAEVLTTRLMGRAFNLIEDSKLLKLDVVSRDFHYNYKCKENCSYPLKTSIGEGKALKVELNIWNNYTVDSNFYQIHPSNELPLIGYREGLRNCSFYDILVTPNIIKSEDDLKSLDVKSRNCYFDGERKLKYFKIYTQRNCEMECFSHAVYSHCTCVPYNYIRDSFMDVCDEYSMKECFYDIVTEKPSNYDYLYESHGVCRCLPPCNEVKYSYEVYKNKFDRNLSISNSLIQMRWKDSEYYAMIRVQEFKLVDFFSYAGGILGLFAGISVLSIFEIFYFLTLRLGTDLLRVWSY